MEPPPKGPSPGESSDIPQALRGLREEILQRWSALAGQNRKATELSQERLLDHLPRLLDDLATAVERSARGDTEEVPLEASDIHALHRLDEGFDLPELAEEYAMLRQAVFAAFRERAPHLVVEGFDVVGTQIDRALGASVARYEQTRNRTLEALDRVSQAAVGAEDVTILLHRLLQVMMKTVPAVDSVAILLKEGERLRVRDAVGLIEERDRGFSLAVGEGFAGTIAKTGQPVYLRSAATDPLIRSDFIRARGVRALYGVPLWRGKEVVGVAHMGSITAFEFASEDMLLFRLMAERAAGLIHQAELMDKERLARAELEAVFEAVPEAIYVGDASGVSRANKAALEMLGLERPEQLQTDIGSLVALIQTRHLDGRPMLLEEQVFARALQGHSEQRDVLIRQVQGGQDRIVHSSAAPIRDSSGQVLGAVAVNRDITERHQAEAKLRESEERLRLAMEVSGLGTWDFDVRTRALHWSEGTKRLLGLRPDQEPNPTTFWGRIHPDDRLAVQAKIDQAIAPGSSGRLESECRVRYPDGTERWLSTLGQVYFDPEGKPWRVVGVARDVTEARRSAQFQERLTGIVSHDLRTPLSVLSSSAQLLFTHPDAPPWVLSSAARIRRSVDRMSRMVSDLLDFTRIRALGGMPIQRQPMDLRAWLLELLEELEQASPGRLHLSVPAEPVKGEWDPDRLGQVVTNLVANALHHGQLGGQIRVGLEAGPEQVLLWVRNQGAAIPERAQATLFDPFKRAVDGDGGGGLGLGLHIVYEIVKAHGGTIRLASNEAEGTTFTAQLPRHPARRENPPAGSR